MRPLGIVLLIVGVLPLPVLIVFDRLATGLRIAPLVCIVVGVVLCAWHDEDRSGGAPESTTDTQRNASWSRSDRLTRTITLVACLLGLASSVFLTSVLTRSGNAFWLGLLAFMVAPFILIGLASWMYKALWAFALAAVAGLGLHLYIVYAVATQPRSEGTGWAILFAPVYAAFFAIPIGAAVGGLIDWIVRRQRVETL
jgi:hypothetical protein